MTKYIFSESYNLVIIHVRRIQAGVESYRHISIQTHGRVEHSVQIPECNAALWHFIYNEVQCVTFQIQQNTHRAAGWDSAFDATLVYGVVLKPRTLSVNVHRKSLIVFTWANRERDFNSKLSVWSVTNCCDLWCHNGISFKWEKKLFTKHFISADIDARDAKSGIGICTVFINRELPIMNSSRESDGAERHTMFPAVGRHSPVVIHET